MSARKDISPEQRARVLTLLRAGMSFDGIASVLGMSRTTLWARRMEDPEFESLFQQATGEWEADQVVAMSDRKVPMEERKFALELLKNRKSHAYGTLKDAGNRDRHVEDEPEARAPNSDATTLEAIELYIAAKKAGQT